MIPDIHLPYLRGYPPELLEEVSGLVRKPLSLSLNEIKALPARTQVTQHNCDEGWTAIGQWTGVPLSHVLSMAELAPEAR